MGSSISITHTYPCQLVRKRRSCQQHEEHDRINQYSLNLSTQGCCNCNGTSPKKEVHALHLPPIDKDTSLLNSANHSLNFFPDGSNNLQSTPESTVSELNACENCKNVSRRGHIVLVHMKSQYYPNHYRSIPNFSNISNLQNLSKSIPTETCQSESQKADGPKEPPKTAFSSEFSHSNDVTNSQSFIYRHTHLHHEPLSHHCENKNVEQDDTPLKSSCGAAPLNFDKFKEFIEIGRKAIKNKILDHVSSSNVQSFEEPVLIKPSHKTKRSRSLHFTNPPKEFKEKHHDWFESPTILSRKKKTSINSPTKNRTTEKNEALGNDEIEIIVTPPMTIPDLSHLNISPCQLREKSNNRNQKRKMARIKKREHPFGLDEISSVVCK